MSPTPKLNTPSRKEAAEAAQLAPFSWAVPHGVPECVTGRRPLSTHQRHFRFRLAHILRTDNKLGLPVNKLANTLSVNGLSSRQEQQCQPLIEVFPDHGVTFHNPAEIALSLQNYYRGVGPTTQEKLNRLMLRLTTTTHLNLDCEQDT